MTIAVTGRPRSTSTSIVSPYGTWRLRDADTLTQPIGRPTGVDLARTPGRIAVLDGAWGTMLQQAGLTDADYRGERFADHPRDVAGEDARELEGGAGLG